MNPTPGAVTRVLVPLGRSGLAWLAGIAPACAQDDAVPPEPRDDRAADVTLLVVDREGTPLPDALVCFALEDERLLRLALPSVLAVDGMLLDHPEVQAGPDGRIRIPWPRDRGLLVAGRHEESWGYLFRLRDGLEAERELQGDEPLRLELVPDWSLTVRVVDGEGKCLSRIPIRLRTEHTDVSVKTRDGEFIFPHLGYELRDDREPAVVELVSFPEPRVAASVDPRRPPAGPITLVVPPTGSVEVVVLDADGQPSRSYVELSYARPEPPEESRLLDRSIEQRPDFRTLANDGKARFDGVALERELTVVVSDPWVRQFIRGPESAGAIVTTTIVLPALLPR